MQSATDTLKNEEARMSKSAIITFCSLATLVFAVGFATAYHYLITFLLIQLGVQVVLSAIAVAAAFKIFKH